ncbi:MAG: hypothetical protein L0H84_17680, partial [Pseudonocardia sp.]|nr:hypothetical protein [Pseudonocardia sp.]
MAPLLDRLTDGRGRTAAVWSRAPLAGTSRALEIVPDGDGLVVAVDAGGARSASGALPLRTNAVDGLCLIAVPAGPRRTARPDRLPR